MLRMNVPLTGRVRGVKATKNISNKKLPPGSLWSFALNLACVFEGECSHTVAIRWSGWCKNLLLLSVCIRSPTMSVLLPGLLSQGMNATTRDCTPPPTTWRSTGSKDSFRCTTGSVGVGAAVRCVTCVHHTVRCGLGGGVVSCATWVHSLGVGLGGGVHV